MSETLTAQESGQSEIFKGSKSFSLASLFFDKKQKHGAWALYRWCRFVDDEIDEAPINQIPAKLADVKQSTRLAFKNPNECFGAYKTLGWAAHTFSLQEKHTLDLIAGLEMDFQGAVINDEEELLKYCYYVAGTVGLMMCSIMGVRNVQAYIHAEALGKAMQLTNIARDLTEDLQRNRIYVPLTWLNEKNITPDVFFEDSEVRAIFSLKLIKLSEKYYEQGFAGIRYLPFRAALAVSAAAFIYRSIGLKIKKNPIHYQQHRAIVPLYKKIFWILRGLVFTIQTRGRQWK